MPYLLFLFICSVWGTSFIAIDRAAHALGPLAIAAGRLLSGAIVLGIYWAWSGRRVRLTHADWANILLVGLVANAWPFAVLPYVMKQAGEHGYFGAMVSLVPLVTIVASIPMLGIWPTRRQLVGVLGGLLCLGVVVYDGANRGISPWLLSLALSVPVTYAVGNTYIKWKLDHLPSLSLTVLFLAAGGIALLPLLLLPGLLAQLHLGGPAVPHDWPLAIFSLAALGIFSTGLAVLMFIYLVKHQGPLFAGMVTYVIPVIALAWGYFDGEQLTSMQLTGLAGVLLSVALVQWGAAESSIRAVPDPLLD